MLGLEFLVVMFVVVMFFDVLLLLGGWAIGGLLLIWHACLGAFQRK